MNVVATADGNIVEIQGTGEERSFSRAELDRLIDLALGAVPLLAERQNQALAQILEEVAAAQKPRRSDRRTPAKDERNLWGKTARTARELHP